MDESGSRFRIPKTSDEENASIMSSVPKSTVYENKWAIQIFENGKAKEQTRFSPLSKAECSKVTTLVWMCKS